MESCRKTKVFGLVRSWVSIREGAIMVLSLPSMQKHCSVQSVLENRNVISNNTPRITIGALVGGQTNLKPIN